MQSVLIEDFRKYVEDNNLEVFKSSYLNNILIDIKKGEGGDFETFKSEVSIMTPIEVIKKDLTREIVYVRKPQIEWDEDIVKGDLGEYLQVTDGVYLDTELNKALGRVGLRYRDEPVLDETILKAMDAVDIIKGKRGQVGEIRTWSGKKYQKTTQGWIPVKNQGGESESVEEKKGDEEKEIDYSKKGSERVKVGDSIKHKSTGDVVKILGVKDDYWVSTSKSNGEFVHINNFTKPSGDRIYWENRVSTYSQAKADLKSKIDPKYHKLFLQWDRSLRDVFDGSRGGGSQAAQRDYYQSKKALRDFYEYLDEEHNIKDPLKDKYSKEVDDEINERNERWRKDREQIRDRERKENPEKEKPKVKLEIGKTYSLPAERGMPAVQFSVKEIKGDRVIIEHKGSGMTKDVAKPIIEEMIQDSKDNSKE